MHDGMRLYLHVQKMNKISETFCNNVNSSVDMHNICIITCMCMPAINVKGVTL